ncbi:MAG: riboflavin biosynthesis protein RibF [Alphaproteobacteria bacterium]|nr:MAG: riboflavin biosynthesis protein RibF [Alphaproteobacteria bacterium]
MQTLTNFNDFPTHHRDAVVVVGNFDGVHMGHRYLLAQARDLAAVEKRSFVALTFEPHPRSVLHANGEPFRLTPWPVKARLLAAEKIDVCVCLEFTTSLATLSARRFVADVLDQALGAGRVVVGEGFAFGHGQMGDVELLRQMLGPDRVQVISRQSGHDAEWSASAIRQALRQGRPEDAACALGRFWSLEGTVISGNRLGHQIGVPTANVRLDQELRPRRGVYAVTVTLEVEDKTADYSGIANLGTRPTVGGSHDLLETHIFGHDLDIYGRSIRVALRRFVRDEKRFPNLEALRDQITRDIADVRAAEHL